MQGGSARMRLRLLARGRSARPGIKAPPSAGCHRVRVRSCGNVAPWAPWPCHPRLGTRETAPCFRPRRRTRRRTPCAADPSRRTPRSPLSSIQRVATEPALMPRTRQGPRERGRMPLCPKTREWLRSADLFEPAALAAGHWPQRLTTKHRAPGRWAPLSIGPVAPRAPLVPFFLQARAQGGGEDDDARLHAGSRHRVALARARG
jgi:hypothetical protein